jgi:hypothetical protein
MAAPVSVTKLTIHFPPKVDSGKSYTIGMFLILLAIAGVIAIYGPFGA